MNYTISEDRTRLTLTVDEDERGELREMGEEIHQDNTMRDFFDRFIANEELAWVYPYMTGDLTDAPMLGIFGPDGDGPGGRLVGHWDGQDWFAPVTERWAWMDYQVTSLLEALRDKGEATLIGGN